MEELSQPGNDNSDDLNELSYSDDMDILAVRLPKYDRDYDAHYRVHLVASTSPHYDYSFHITGGGVPGIAVLPDEEGATLDFPLDEGDQHQTQGWIRNRHKNEIFKPSMKAYRLSAPGNDRHYRFKCWTTADTENEFVVDLYLSERD